MKITPELIDAAQRAGESDYILRWLRERPRTVAELAEAKPVWALWLAGRVLEASQLLSSAQLDACAAAEPWAALLHAADRLSPERLDACAAALMHAAALLTPERRAMCHRQVDAA